MLHYCLKIGGNIANCSKFSTIVRVEDKKKEVFRPQYNEENSFHLFHHVGFDGNGGKVINEQYSFDDLL